MQSFGLRGIFDALQIDQWTVQGNFSSIDGTRRRHAFYRAFT
jgi:hypothetical protein